MHPVIARGIAIQQIGDLHAQAAAERRAREAVRPRRPRLAVRRSAAHPVPTAKVGTFELRPLVEP